jgi:hypothetical protein
VEHKGRSGLLRGSIKGNPSNAAALYTEEIIAIPRYFCYSETMEIKQLW